MPFYSKVFTIVILVLHFERFYVCHCDFLCVTLKGINMIHKVIILNLHLLKSRFSGNLNPWWEKMGILARSLPGNLTIWREILTFEIKKYIRNSGKSDYLAGKNTLFQAMAESFTDIFHQKF